MSVKPGLKKRRAPLPEEVYPNLLNESSTNAHPNGLRVGTGLNTTSAEIQPTTLPFWEPSKGPSSFKRHSLPTGVPKLTLNNIRFPSDNEVLDVHESSETDVKALIIPTDYGRKRYSSGDIPKYTRLPFQSGSSSVYSFNASGRLSISLNSISSITSTEYAESQMVDQEDIVNLTAHVRNFSDALSKLRSAFSGSGSDTDSDESPENGNANETMHVKTHEHLGKVLSNLKEVIKQYPSLQSTEILAAAGYLISKIKNNKYEENRIPDDFYQSIDQLALVFSSSISDFLMGDQEPNLKTVDSAGDCHDEFAEDGDEEDFSEGDGLQESQNSVKPDDGDVQTDLTQVILGMKSGVDFCLQWTKSWSKYVKDITNYIEKRAQLEAEYTKQLAKLAQTTRHSICEEEYLPFQSTFSTALDQDLEYSQRCQQTLIAITGSKLMEPLMERRAYHDRARKDMKDQWTKVCKQLHDHVGSVRTSQNMYYKKKHELNKLSTKQSDLKDSKDDSPSVISVFGTNKSKKEEELKLKVDEAKQFYSNAIEDINKVQAEAENTKVRIVTQTKQLVNECDRTFRSATHKYFDLMHELAVPTPIHFKTLAESCHGYEPGKQFESFVRFKQSTAQPAAHKVHKFEEYRITSPHYPGNLSVGPTSPLKTWPVSRDSDVENGVSPAGSPSSSPPRQRPSRPPPSTDDDSDGEMKPEIDHPKLRKNKRRGGKRMSMYKKSISKDAATHTFHKIRAPARCSDCESYVFNGVECGQCGLSWHKKCLENVNTPCSHSRRRPSPMKRMKTFGVRFSEDGGVPVLVTKCVKELNRRGLRVKGIYRVSGVKSKMEGLCEEFETNADSVDLSNEPPHLIASVLKLYIRQLPEPLMTTKLYGELIQLAKESQNVHCLTYEEYDNDRDRNDFKKFLERLKEILNKLPKSNYLTTATLIKHLHKVAKNEEHNQMSSTNLAIVFGPTILRLGSENSTTSLSSLIDMPHQTRIVALLIVHPQLFDKAGDDEDAVSDQESEKTNDTLVEKFVSPQPEEETRMPDLYGVRSNRVRGEGPSPMDKLQSPNVQENKRTAIHDTSHIDERIGVKDKTAGIFNNNGISLPGSLETQNKFLDWVPDDEDVSERDVDVDPLKNNSEQYTEINRTGDSTKGGSPSRTAQGSPSGESTRLPRGVSFDKQNLDYLKSSMNSTETPRQGSDETPPFSVAYDEGQDENEIIPRRRSKAFSAGKRNDPEMLAKRGSALMNAYMDSSSKSEDSPQSSPSGLPAKRTTSGVRDTSSDVDLGDAEASETFANGDESRTSPATVTGETAAESVAAEAESQTTRVATEDGSETSRIKAATSSENITMGSFGGELASWLKSEGRIPRRRRSATYESDRRRDDRLLSGERKLDLGMRSRRTRVSVKDQIMQLEQRGYKNNASRASSLWPGGRQRASSDTRRISADESALSEYVDGNTNLDGEKGETTPPPRKIVRAHEPLSRVRVLGGHIGQSGTEGALLITLPNSSGGMRTPADEEVPFRALKMDISLESPRTPSSNSSDEDVSQADVGKGTGPLNKWAGRGLTPRDSNQAPEFV